MSDNIVFNREDDDMWKRGIVYFFRNGGTVTYKYMLSQNLRLKEPDFPEKSLRERTFLCV